jgi:hypothetical protein
VSFWNTASEHLEISEFTKRTDLILLFQDSSSALLNRAVIREVARQTIETAKPLDGQWGRRIYPPLTVYVMPLEPATRFCPGGAPAVWRSESGGESWSRLARGLPKKQSYFTVLRDAMDIDRLKATRRNDCWPRYAGVR